MSTDSMATPSKDALPRVRTPLMRDLKGIAASGGLVIGKAVVLRLDTGASAAEKIDERQISSEIERFNDAMKDAIQEFQHIITVAEKETNSVSQILETYLMILGDLHLADEIRARISGGYSAENAIIQQFDTQKQFFKLSRDPILRERAVELEHVRDRLLAGLRNTTISHAVAANSIVVAPSITPTDLMLFRKAGVLGFVTEVGGIASHASILARSWALPAIIGARDASHQIHQGETVILDGYTGIITINPDEDAQAFYRQRKIDEENHRIALGDLIDKKAETTDGKHIHLFANIDSLEDVEIAVRNGAQGIGLVRTEYLIIQRQHFPDEEEQFEWYKEIAERAFPLPITIRAFDVGSDKYAEGLPHESNPALGLRGIRFLLHRKDLFKAQIKAVLRASEHRNIRFMLPMVSTFLELKTAQRLIEQVKRELEAGGISHDPRTPVGMMIETPSAAILADKFAEVVDFFSIGTNDLTQYTLGADRTNELVADIFDPFHPSVLRLMSTAIDAAHRFNIPVAVCGEMAGHASAAELLVGLGVDELSVTPYNLLELKKRIRSASYASSKVLAAKALSCNGSAAVRKYLPK